MSVAQIDNLTFWVWVGFVPVWLAWELLLLRWRATKELGGIPRTISMIARDRGWQLSSMVYLWCGLASHFWIPSKAYAHPVAGVAFWAVGVALLGWDFSLAGTDRAAWPKWQRWARFPALVVALGFACGWLLFPQKGELP